MKRNRSAVSLLALALLVAGATAAGAVTSAVSVNIGPSGHPSVNLTFFRNDLAPYGRWVDNSVYGNVFVPAVAPGWRPYSNGHWAYTDAGWTWISDEPFGWATDHYGRWVFDAAYGWTWVPGTQWAPAYVSWQSNNDYVGWAPLPPTVDVGPSLLIGPGGIDLADEIAPASYVFVPTRSFLAADIASVALPVPQSLVIYPQTQNITRYRFVDNAIYDTGLPLPVVERVTMRRVPRYLLGDLAAPMLHPRLMGNRLAFYRPAVTPVSGWRTAEQIARANRFQQRTYRAALSRGIAAENVRFRQAAVARYQAPPLPARGTVRGLDRAQQRLAFNAARNPVAANRGLARAQEVHERNAARQAAHLAAVRQMQAAKAARHQQLMASRIAARQQVHAHRVMARQQMHLRERAQVGRAMRLQHAQRAMHAHRAMRVQARPMRQQARAMRMQARAMNVQARGMRMQARAMRMQARPAQARPMRVQGGQGRAMRQQMRAAGGHGARQGGHGKGGGRVPF